MLKKSIAILLCVMIMSCMCMSAFGFSFPEPDWGALLKERENMVTETEFELYAEGQASSAPYYGQRLEPRAGTYIGSIAETSDRLRPLGSYLTYVEDMRQDDLYYPANDMIENGNSVAMIGWTIDDLNGVDYSQVRKVLDNLNSYNKPMFIRFANEMNCSALGDDPDKYIEVFRTVADMVHEYPNFAMVWSPNDMGALDRPFEYFYPGDEYVDWVGLSSYATLYFAGKKDTAYKDTVYFMTGDYSWHTNRIKPFMDFLEKNNINKPVMISEGGVATGGKFGDNPESWVAPRLRNMLWYLVMKYPQIKMINYFDIYRSERDRYNISDLSYAVDIFYEAKDSGAYLTAYGEEPEFVFSPAKSAGTLYAENGSVPVYALAHFPEKPDATVNYYIDGNWSGSSSQIPYKYNIDLGTLSDGEHTLKISSYYNEKEYTFHKKGQMISFSDSLGDEFVDTPIRVKVNGVFVEFDQQPVIQNDRTLVPLRKIFEALGAVVDWNADTRTVSAERDGTVVSLTIDSDELYVNDNIKRLDVPAQIMEGRTMVPARAIAESFGCNVDWDADTRTVIITE